VADVQGRCDRIWDDAPMSVPTMPTVPVERGDLEPDDAPRGPERPRRHVPRGVVAVIVLPIPVVIVVGLFFERQRADTIMLVHLPADRQRVYVISFPRDSWVRIPGHGKAKINAAFSFGGPPLLISTVERLTRARIEHFAIVDFAGFESMTDALGGVDVRVAETVRDPARKVVWPAGTHHLDGAQALDFVRQRYNLPGGDFDRIKRQHAFLKALAGGAVAKDTLTNPLKLNAFLEATTRAMSVDETLTLPELRSLAVQFRAVRRDDVVFMTAPVAGTGTEDGGQSVVYLDRARSRPLYRALRSDAVDRYVTAAGDAVNQVDEVR
jgi:LCP family protein required for cell wall assembly